MFFAMESLSSVGETHKTSERIRKACIFLLSKQQEDGGWGETYKVGLTKILFEYSKLSNDAFSLVKLASIASTKNPKSFKLHGRYYP
jgi:hypothetical protein